MGKFRSIRATWPDPATQHKEEMQQMRDNQRLYAQAQQKAARAAQRQAMALRAQATMMDSPNEYTQRAPVKAPTLAVKPDTTLSTALNNEIKRFDRSTLRKQVVYYASKGNYRFAPRIHGYTVIGTPGTKNQPGFGQLYQSRQMRMYTEYFVSAKLVATVLKSSKFSKAIKDTIKALKGRRFQYVELFLKELYMLQAKKTGLDIKDKQVQEKILLQTTNTQNGELRELIVLNQTVNKVPLMLLPGKTHSVAAVKDLRAFELDASTLGLCAQPNIDAMAVREIFQQQLLFTRYIEEKAGIGESVSLEQKLQSNIANNHSKPFLLVEYSMLPSADNMYAANCNKVAASLLQAAGDLTAEREKRSPCAVKSASIWSIGSSQRMYLWNPLRQSLKGTVLQLIGKTVLKKSQLEKQELVNNKLNILKVILSLPNDKQRQALEESLNPATALGQLFYAKRTGMWRQPALGRGYLKEAKKALKKLKENSIKIKIR